MYKLIVMTFICYKIATSTIIFNFNFFNLYMIGFTMYNVKLKSYYSLNVYYILRLHIVFSDEI